MPSTRIAASSQSALVAVLCVCAGACFSDPADADMVGSTGPTDTTSTSTMASSGQAPTSAADSGSTVDPATSSSSDDEGTTEMPTSGGASTTDDSGSGSTGGPTSLCGFVDDFDAPPSPLWQYTMEGLTSVSAGELVMTVTRPGDDPNNRMLLPAGSEGFVDRSVTLELGDVAVANGMLQMLRLETAQAQGPDLVSFRVIGFGSGPQLQVWHSEDNANPQEPYSVPFDADAHRFLRITEQMGQLRFSVSSNGMSFDEVYAFAPGYDLSLAQVGIAAGNYLEQPADVDVSFRSFRIHCP